MRRQRPNSLIVLLVAAMVVIGAATSLAWVTLSWLAPAPQLVSWTAVSAALGTCAAMTSLNVAVRWLRWHFLVRRSTRRIATRDSLIVYLATLPAIITPFFVGELVRVMILRRRLGPRALHVARVWVIERLLDAAVLASFFLMTIRLDAGLLGLAAVGGCSFLMFQWLLDARPSSSAAAVSVAALAATVLAWILPTFALQATVALLSGPIRFDVAVKSFSLGTLLGGLSGMPLGVSVTGSTMIRELLQGGAPLQVAVLSVLVHRMGTAWFAVVAGLLAFVFWRPRLARIARTGTGGHFDEIAEDYEDQIPTHVRDRLLLKKCGLIRGHLQSLGAPANARGLDLGCGQGWYMAELARAGYRVEGLDAATEQLKQARSYLAAGGHRPRLLHGDALALPFADNVFDFVYSINAFHHFASFEAQQRSLGEVARVLRPGGTFILHEINTLNPLFRAYVGYVFPLLRDIDEGTERWLMPTALPAVAGARWLPEVTYFTFMPDFVPPVAQRLLGRTELALERSSWRQWSAHYQACLVKYQGRAAHGSEASRI